MPHKNDLEETALAWSPKAAAGAFEAFEAFDGLLESGGVRAALFSVLMLTVYRCVGIFRLQAGRPVALEFCYRERPDVLLSGAVPRAVSEACFFRDARGSLTTLRHQPSTMTGTRDDGSHSVVCRSLPVIDPEGLLYGTLCLYDTAADPVEHELDLMLWLPVASRLASTRCLPSPTD